MPNLTPTLVDQRYASHGPCRLDVYRHQVRDAGGNPCLIWRHGGGWTTNDKRLPALASGRGNEVFTHLRDKIGLQDTHVTCISIGTRQAAYGSPSSSHPDNATIGWYDEGEQDPTYFPHTFTDYATAVRYIVANASTLGIDPERIVLGGSSAGSVMALHAAHSLLEQPGRSPYPNAWGAGEASVPRIRGVIGYQLPIDFRLRPGGVESIAFGQWSGLHGTYVAAHATALPAAARNYPSPAWRAENSTPSTWIPLHGIYLRTRVQFNSAAYTTASKQVALTGAFASYTFQSGDRVFLTGTAGAGVFTINSKVDDNTIDLTTDYALSDIASVSGYVIPSYPLADPHDDQQHAAMAALCQSRNLAYGGGVFEATQSSVIGQSAYEFIRSVAG